MAVVDNAVYVAGRRVAAPEGLEETYRVMRERDGLGWIGLYRPEHAEVESLSEHFDLHALAVEDTVTAHQRPKLERYGHVLFTVLRPARYLEAEERVEFGELHVFTGPDFVVTVRHAESPDLSRVRARLEDEAGEGLLRLGAEAVLYAVLDEVVDEYEPVVDGLENDIDEIEDQVFAGDPEVSRRVYELLREVVAFQRATHPLPAMLDSLRDGFDRYGVDEELRRHLRDVEDHVVRVVERVDAFRALLHSILTVNATLVAQRQNEASLRQSEEVKKISAWAAILFAPTLVGTVYGMNFRVMPELGWRLGYPFALLLMLGVCVGLYAVFKRRRWL
ncbi:magnesium and cobalt transport protein CorA [Aquipuribacter nitratireducens]|uniref:Magnesium and cobalt transport protein CorA n=1 Tax=Aquipuribacter nitratireducens TaxID=650104 RepID=A0ABW0GN31_9MICO